MPAGELNGKIRGHNRIVLSVENQRGLPDLRIIFILMSVCDQLIAELDRAALAVMENFEDTTALPFVHGCLSQSLRPARGEAEGWRHEPQFLDFGVAGGK